MDIKRKREMQNLLLILSQSTIGLKNSYRYRKLICQNDRKTVKQKEEHDH